MDIWILFIASSVPCWKFFWPAIVMLQLLHGQCYQYQCMWCSRVCLVWCGGGYLPVLQPLSCCFTFVPGNSLPKLEVPTNVSATSDEPITVAVTALDDDNDTVTYKLVDDNGGLYSINNVTGVINATFSAVNSSSLRSVVYGVKTSVKDLPFLWLDHSLLALHLHKVC